METLSELPFDSLSEIINAGANLAAQSLGDVVGSAVQVTSSKIALIKSIETSIPTLWLNAENFGVVSQTFRAGEVSSDVMLIFSQEHALQIVRKMMGAEFDDEMLHEYESEAMCELGNIMVHACLSSIADTLHISTESTLPVYAVKTGNEMITDMQNNTAYAFVIAAHVSLDIEQQPFEMKLFFLMNSTAF